MRLSRAGLEPSGVELRYRGRTPATRAQSPCALVPQISGDSRTVAFTAERLATPPGPSEHDPGPPLTLLTAPILGQEKASLIAGPFHGPGSVSDFQLSADISVVVYLADQGEPFAIELYAARRTPVASASAAKR